MVGGLADRMHLRWDRGDGIWELSDAMGGHPAKVLAQSSLSSFGSAFRRSANADKAVDREAKSTSQNRLYVHVPGIDNEGPVLGCTLGSFRVSNVVVSGHCTLNGDEARQIDECQVEQQMDNV